LIHYSIFNINIVYILITGNKIVSDRVVKNLLSNWSREYKVCAKICHNGKNSFVKESKNLIR